MQKPTVHIRPAALDDAESIERLRHAAVHKHGIRSYSQEQLNQWAPAPSADRIRAVRRAIQSDQEVMIVAVVGNRVAGFGSIIPAGHELRAVYVHPDFARRGVGRTILRELEAVARDLGLDHLDARSSLNAEPFYNAQGYQSLGRFPHRMSTGYEITCVNITKRFNTPAG